MKCHDTAAHQWVGLGKQSEESTGSCPSRAPVCGTDLGAGLGEAEGVPVAGEAEG